MILDRTLAKDPHTRQSDSYVQIGRIQSVVWSPIPPRYLCLYHYLAGARNFELTPASVVNPGMPSARTQPPYMRDDWGLRSSFLLFSKQVTILLQCSSI